MLPQEEWTIDDPNSPLCAAKDKRRRHDGRFAPSLGSAVPRAEADFFLAGVVKGVANPFSLGGHFPRQSPYWRNFS